MRHRGDQAKSEAALRKVHEAKNALEVDVLQPIVKALYERASAQGRKGADWFEVLRKLMPASSVGARVDEFKQRRGRHALESWLAGEGTPVNAASLAASLGLSVPLAERLRAQTDAQTAYAAARAAVRHF